MVGTREQFHYLLFGSSFDLIFEPEVFIKDTLFRLVAEPSYGQVRVRIKSFFLAIKVLSSFFYSVATYRLPDIDQCGMVKWMKH